MNGAGEICRTGQVPGPPIVADQPTRLQGQLVRLSQIAKDLDFSFDGLHQKLGELSEVPPMNAPSETDMPEASCALDEIDRLIARLQRLTSGFFHLAEHARKTI